MLLIDFFEVIPINALLPIRTLSPDKVAYLIDTEQLDTTDARHMEQAVSGVEGVTSFTYVPIRSDDVEQMKERMRAVIESAAPDESVFIDLTGGTDLMVASGYSVAMETRAVPIHIDLVRREVFRVDTLERIGGVTDISLKDYLTAIGAKQLRGSRGNPTDEEGAVICEMAEVLFRRTSEWHALCDKIAIAFSKKSDSRSRTFSITNRIEYVNKRGFNPKSLMKEFCRRGFVRYLGEEDNLTEGEPGERVYHYELTDIKYKEYMTIFGIWLEMYVYFKTKPYFDEAYLGMVIDWDNDDEVDTVDNEIDVALMKGSVPYFISCKLRKLEAADIYEIGFITERFGGDYGKCFVATTHSLESSKRGPRSLHIKMDKMNVGLILVTEDYPFRKLIQSQRMEPRVIEDELEP